MNFRKGILALAVAGLGLTGVASAQITCTGGLQSAGVSTIRAEGMTEVIPDLTITGCTGTANTGTISVSVTTSAGVTNIATASGSSATDATATFLGDNAHVISGVVQGNALVFTYTTSNIPGTPGTSIVIHNVRVNASSQAVNTNVTSNVTATTGLNLGGSSVTYSNVASANIQRALAAPVVGGFNNTPICTAPTTPIAILEAQISNNFFGSLSPTTTGAVDYVQVTFGNLVPGVNYYVPASITGTNVSVALAASNTDTTGVTGVTVPSSGTGLHLTGVYQLTATNGSATALYLITSPTSFTNANQSFIVPLFATVPSGSTTVGLNSPTTVTAQLMGPATGYDQFAAPNPAPTPVAAAKSTLADVTGTVLSTAVGAGPTSTGELTSCATSLLFPYVLNVAGYDTGIALTNASAGTSVAQAGTCSVQFYGTGAPSTNPFVTPSVTAGTVTAFTVSSVASGFQGYAIASCNFQNAHGFAFITDGYGQAGRGLSQGYLAIITAEAGAAVTGSPF